MNERKIVGGFEAKLICFYSVEQDTANGRSKIFIAASYNSNFPTHKAIYNWQEQGGRGR
jgi:hypothetical protein